MNGYRIKTMMNRIKRMALWAALVVGCVMMVGCSNVSHPDNLGAEILSEKEGTLILKSSDLSGYIPEGQEVKLVYNKSDNSLKSVEFSGGDAESKLLSKGVQGLQDAAAARATLGYALLSDQGLANLTQNFLNNQLISQLTFAIVNQCP